LTPKTVAELVKLAAKHGKHAVLVSGVDPLAAAPASGRVAIDVTAIAEFTGIAADKSRVTIGTGVNLGRLAREAVGENGLIRQAASLVASPLVRNRVTLAEALDPISPHFDITTPFVLLNAKVRLQSPTGKRAMNIRDYLDAATKGLKKGEIPVAVEFPKLPAGERVGFFRVARARGQGMVSAAARMRLMRNVCVDPEIVVSSFTVVPLRSAAAEKVIGGKTVSEAGIQQAAQQAALEIGAFAERLNAYEQTLIEITVARTLRGIMEGTAG
jgi:carbon-monoxide dehydrogenase medium subunit